jgi:hypothetical protein
VYGRKENEDIYGLETKNHYTRNFFADCRNVQVFYTNAKHVWDGGEIKKIIRGQK